MPSLVQYRLGSPVNLIEDIELLKIISPLCMDGLSYEILFNGEPISSTS